MRIFYIVLLSLSLLLQGCTPSYKTPPATFIKEGCYKQLLDIPARKGTVGVIVTYKKGGMLYSLLGKESVSKGHTEKSGQFCDLGGSIKLDGSTSLDNMLRELSEESIQMFKPIPTVFLKKAHLVHLHKKERDIWYAVYMINDREFISSAILNHLRNSLSKSLPSEYKEKQEYLWVNLPALIQQVIQNPTKKVYYVTDIEGHSHIIKLRKFFIEDCLSNPFFQKIIASLVD